MSLSTFDASGELPPDLLRTPPRQVKRSRHSARTAKETMATSIPRDGLRVEAPRTSAAAESPPSPAFLDLFHAIDALRTGADPIVVQFAGTDQHAPTAQVVSAFARTAARATQGPILYVDATGGGIWAGPDMLRAFREGMTPAEIALPTHEPRIRWAATGRMLALAGEDSSRLLDAIRQCFSLTVIDCGSMGSGTSAIPLARHCDGSVLVTEADKTRASAIGLSRTAIERAGGRLLGAVLNGGDSALPRWLAARI